MPQVKHDHALADISSTLSVTSVGALAKKKRVSIHVFLKATACSTSAFDIACGFQRLTHLQSSAESMSSCELCFKISHAVQFMSSCTPSMTSSSENSESAWKS